MPIIAIASPLLCYVIASHSAAWFGGYVFSYEVLILNALITMLGLWLCRKGRVADKA